MDELANKITLLRTELNLTQDPAKRTDLNKQLNVLLLRKEIETIRKKIDQLNNS
jgi:hypothetical protein